MAVVFKCCFCRDNIEPVDSEWVGQLSRTAECRINGRHARQVVLNVKEAA